MQVLLESDVDVNELLSKAETDGGVQVVRSDGQRYVVTVVRQPSSPLDVPSLGLDISTDEIVAAVRQGREQS